MVADYMHITDINFYINIVGRPMRLSLYTENGKNILFTKNLSAKRRLPKFVNPIVGTFATPQKMSVANEIGCSIRVQYWLSQRRPRTGRELTNSTRSRWATVGLEKSINNDTAD
jgi:hypothetical protein